ncbi:hypothetical protein FRC06_011382 [Ceratobasidium sp. 370]|nr:hypothetical protein FRC06_011382 [Ceratobasidium sp. 370]
MQARSYKGDSEGPKLVIVTCLGKAWAMWEGGKMGLLFVSPDAPAMITAVTLDESFVWALAGPHIIKYTRGKEVGRATNPLNTTLSSFLLFGSHLICLTSDGACAIVWEKNTLELQGKLTFSNGFTAAHMLHPATYINKVLFASSDGSMQLWNIRTSTCLHIFPSTNLSAMSSGSPITTLAQSPAVDVIGIGFASGECVLYDVRADERVIRVFMEGAAVRSIAFRTDGHPVLATASAAGHIALWDLNAQGRLLHILKGAHNSSISAIQWIPGQPVMVTSGEDNSLKQWLFESPDDPPRLLKYRSGHHAPPHLIRYYGEDGKQLLTASRDRSLRYTSVVRDSRSHELSQGSLEQKATSLAIPISHLKLPAITSLSYSSTRSKDWEDVLTSHTGETFARTWSVQNKKLGKWSMGGTERAKGVSAKGRGTDVSLGEVKRLSSQAVCVSACGNFGFIGTTQGLVQSYNMQSGLRRRLYDAARGQSVTGVATDALNRLVVVSTLDGTIHSFSYDSRWLTACSLDNTIRTFDIPTGRLIDAFKTPSVATSVALSPSGDFLATAHVDSVGIFLWSVYFLMGEGLGLISAYIDRTNKAQYSDVSLQSVGEGDAAMVNLPSMQGEDESEDLDLGELAELSLADDAKRPTGTMDQLDGELITLTVLPRSKWQTLLNLEVIQARNKPIEPPKAPEKAPFFLPTVAGVEHKLDATAAATKQKSDNESHRKQNSAVRIETELQRQLRAEDQDGPYDAFFAQAQALSPAALDVELRSLSSLPDLSLFLHALTQRLKSHRDFEAVQTYLAVFLRLHGDVLMEHSELMEKIKSLAVVHKQESERITELVDAGLGKLGFVRGIL